MSELTDAVELMLAAVGDAVEVWAQIGERVTKLENRCAALALKVDMLMQGSKDRASDTRAPDLGKMLRGVAERLNALEDAMQTLTTDADASG